MHPVLQNHYLLHEIMEWLELYPMTCSSAALTCRAFRKPSQDVLWRNLEFCGVLPLFKLLTNLKCRLTETGNRLWFLDDCVTLADVEQMKTFGARVRSIEHDHSRKSLEETDHGEIVDVSVFVAVASALKGHLLVPNLRSLSLTMGHKHYSAAVLQLLLSPRLRHLTLQSGDQDFTACVNDVCLYLKQLARSDTDTLHTLDFSGFPCNQAALQTIPACHSLSSLRLKIEPQAVAKQDFCHSLSQLPNLSELNIEAHSFDWGRALPSIFHFPALTTLEIACHFEDVVQLFSRFRFPVLQTLEHSFMLPSAPLDHIYPWDRYFNAIGSSTASHFHDLSIERWIDAPDARSRWKEFGGSYAGVPFGEIRHSLQTLKHRLTRLWIAFPLVNVLTNEYLEEMADMWPTMKDLSVRASSAGTLNTSSLRLIATKFPDMEELWIQLDCARISRPRRGSNHPLKWLQLQLSSWGGSYAETDRFVTYLDSLFPRLSALRNWSVGSAKYDLEDRLEWVQSIRKRERYRHSIQETDDDDMSRNLGVGDESENDGDEESQMGADL